MFMHDTKKLYSIKITYILTYVSYITHITITYNITYNTYITTYITITYIYIYTIRTYEKAKESKHKKTCETTRRDFIPFIVSIDGCLGNAAEIFLKRISRKLAEKWQRAYSQVVGFIKARISIAILRASSHCLRGPRTHVQGTVCVMEDGAALDAAMFL